jgi:hypothetical protein
MSSKPMEEGNDPLIQLFRTVEEGLSIAGSNAQSSLGLSLDTAELELNLGILKKGTAGIEVKALGIDASVSKEVESTHVYKLKLRRGPKPYLLGNVSAQELAETILALGKATQSVAQRATNFVVDEAVVTVDVTESKEGALKFGVGGQGGSQNICRVTLTFTRIKK